MSENNQIMYLVVVALGIMLLCSQLHSKETVIQEKEQQINEIKQFHALQLDSMNTILNVYKDDIKAYHGMIEHLNNVIVDMENYMHSERPLGYDKLAMPIPEETKKL